MARDQVNKYLILLLPMVMFLLSFAAVPLYNIFCKTTGYGGTTQIAEALPGKVGKRFIKVRFDANIDPSLQWNFIPQQDSIVVQVGALALAFYTAINLTSQPLYGMAVYNVMPEKAGKYFHKIHCFCFAEQALAPQQNLTMPVSFYLDPDLENDPDLQQIETITLSYTFFKLNSKI